MKSSYDAIVVGAGPNGLAAAITLARNDLSVLLVEANESIGGGLRTGELTEPGFRHDLCSAIHPLGAGSPFFRTLPLDQHGLEWIHPVYPAAHPLDGGRAGVLSRGIGETGRGLGADDRGRRGRTALPRAQSISDCCATAPSTSRWRARYRHR